uniref:Uncharacterized protein n=1 Tax=Fusarium oxysporum (strain Fo5176) TaxID=660025 RepID=A0A0D2X808_FUSOF
MSKFRPQPENAGNNQPSTLYSLVMTPVNITVFLFSLLLVDFRHTAGRNNFYGTEEAHEDGSRRSVQMRSTMLVFMAVALALATSAVWFLTSRLYYGVASLVEPHTANQTIPPTGP